MAYRGLTGNGDSQNKTGRKTPVDSHDKKEEQYTKRTTTFYDKDGKEIGSGHLNERGEIVKGPLEIRVSDNLIIENGKEYTINDYVLAQKKACEERGNGYVYIEGIKGIKLNRMGIKGRVSKKAISERRAISLIEGYKEYSRGN